MSSRGAETGWALEASWLWEGGQGAQRWSWGGPGDAAFGGELGVRSASVLALGPLCRRSAPGVDRLQLHDRGHLPDRQSRAASHSRPHAGRRREGRARAQNCKDNEELHEYLDRVDRGVSPRSNDGGRDRRRFTKVIEEVRGGSTSQRSVCFHRHPTVASWLTHPAKSGERRL